MKRLLFLLCGALAVLEAAGQDTILLRDAREIRAHVEEVDPKSVAYRDFGNPTGPLRRIGRERIVKITYANGEKEVYADDGSLPAAADDYPWPPVSRSYRIGELFSEGGVVGVVIRVREGGRHGLLASLDMEQAAFADGYLAEVPIGMTDTADGWRNRRTLERFVLANSLSWECFPAFAWCRGLGPGWYIPAVEEFKALGSFAQGGRYPRNELEIYRMCRELGRACEQAGGIGFGPFTPAPLSSTEASSARVWHIRPERERGAKPRDADSKSYTASVRAFHRF